MVKTVQDYIQKVSLVSLTIFEFDYVVLKTISNKPL